MIPNHQILNSLMLFKALPAKAMYFLGVLQVKTQLAIDVIGNFLERLYLSYEFNDETWFWIEDKLLDGRIGEVNDFLETDYVKKNNQKIISLIEKLKTSKLYSEKYEIIQFKSCFLCGNLINIQENYLTEHCGHLFHKKCLIDEIDYLLDNKVTVLRCPSCIHNFKWAELKFLPNRVLKKLKNLDWYKKSGAEKVQCSNLKCGNVFAIGINQKACGNCGVKVSFDTNS
jgi:hypothetical protein